VKQPEFGRKKASLTKVSSYGVASTHAMTVGVSKANPNEKQAQ
jgi:hypothetical protein